MYISLGWKIKQNHKWLHLLLDTALWNLKLRYPMKRGLLLLTFRVQLECQSADLKPSGAHTVPPILETAYALQFHSLDPVIAKAKPKSDDVISPNNSPFSESVITVYTFPCQSAGLPLSLLFFSCWQLVLWTFGWNKHSFLGHERLSPWSGASAHSPEFRTSWWGFFRSGMVMLWRWGGSERDRVTLDSSPPLPLATPRCPFPLISLDWRCLSILELMLQYEFWGLWSPSCRSQRTGVIRGPALSGKGVAAHLNTKCN